MDASFLTTRTIKNQFALRMVRVAGPFALSIIAAWGTVQYARGRTAERLDTLDKQIEETRKGLSNTLTREEFKTWTEEQREHFRQLHDELKEVRRRL